MIKSPAKCLSFGLLVIAISVAMLMRVLTSRVCVCVCACVFYNLLHKHSTGKHTVSCTACVSFLLLVEQAQYSTARSPLVLWLQHSFFPTWVFFSIQEFTSLFHCVLSVIFLALARSRSSFQSQMSFIDRKIVYCQRKHQYR